MLTHFSKPPLQEIHYEQEPGSKIRISVLREDLLHPFLSGNKWRKLKYNLEDFKHSQKKAILTFGGKFSNHLVACAAAGKMFGIPMIAVLRGEEDVQNTNLEFLRKCGMNLLAISREEYRKRNEPLFLEELSLHCLKKFPSIIQSAEELFIIPEGGANESGVKGCSEIIKNIPDSATHICVACGTGSTLAGISKGIKSHQKAIGISVLKGENFLPDAVRKFGGIDERFKILFAYHSGGYGKSSAELRAFCNTFSEKYKIPIEPVYTGKLFFGMLDLLKKNYFPENSHVVMVHTGGIFDFKIPVQNVPISVL